MKVKPKDNNGYSMILSKKIMTSSTLTGCITYGVQRVGKSTYSMLVAYDIYRDWDKVLDSIFFKLEDVIRVLKDAVNKDKMIPILIWDDAGIHANKMKFFTDRLLVEYLGDLMDVVGTVVRGFIFTTPDPQKLLKAIRGYEFYRVKVVKQNSTGYRRATGYRSILLPSGKKIVSKEFFDFFTVKIPDPVYKKYIEQRKGYTKDALANLEDALGGDKKK